MKQNSDTSGPPAGGFNRETKNEKAEQFKSASSNGSPFHSNGHTNGHRNGHSQPQKLDFWVAMDILAKRWHWLAIGGILLAGTFFYLGSNLIKERFTASGVLRRTDLPAFFTSTPTSPETFAALIRAPALLQRVGEKADPPMLGEDLGKCLKVDPQPESDMVKVLLQMRDARQAVKLVNSYMEEAVKYTKELQHEHAARLSGEYLTKQLDKIQEGITVLENEFRGLGTPKKLEPGSTNTMAVQAMSPRTQELKQRYQALAIELTTLLDKYTELHPSVINLKERIADLQHKIATESTNASPGTLDIPISAASAIARNNSPALNPEADIIHIRLLALQETHAQMLKNQQEAEIYSQNPPGMAEVFATANLKTIKSNMRIVKIGALSAFGGVLGMFLSFMLIALVELTDSRLRTTDDLQRVTRLPVLTTLGDLKTMDNDQRAQWAFRAWTMLQGRLSPSANHGLVCGITSSAAREGRSTWIGLLAEAASLTGFRVLTIATKASPSHSEEESLKALPENIAEPAVNGSRADSVATTSNSTTALVQNALKTPSTVTEQLTGPDSQPVVHIPLPGWVWNLERRKEWGNALDHWRCIDNLVILVELPPADVPEAVLLGSNLPNLVWLADSGRAHAGDTRAQLETLRDARCNLVGAVLNREPAIPIKKRFPRWLGCIAIGFALTVSSAKADSNAAAPQPAPPPTSAVAEPSQTGPSGTNLAFSVVRPSQRAAWQQHLTLGPGDVVNLGLFGQPELNRMEVSIGPDGRVNYLEAQDVMADGLTVDELRSKLDQELAKYRRTPRSMVTPVTFRSKRYYMLGKVMTKGVYLLDRPITVLEAIARAHGLENGLVDRNVVDLADFERSFLARGGKRYPLNFEKLFQEGDLSQNIPIEPGDYIFFPSTNVKEVYVVGEVRLPGTAIYNPNTTIIAAIAARGGYTDRAYKARVLVVRGSLNNPEAFAVDTHAILDARAPDFKLQPRDIIYVNSRPFIRVEETLDMAVTAFIQSAITTFTGVNVVKPIP